MTSTFGGFGLDTQTWKADLLYTNSDKGFIAAKPLYKSVFFSFSFFSISFVQPFSKTPRTNCKAQYGRMINCKGHSKQMWRLKYASSLFIFSDQTQLRRTRKPSARPQTLRSFATPFCAKGGQNSAVNLFRLLPFPRENRRRSWNSISSDEIFWQKGFKWKCTLW